jgi:hypothetical protein
MYTQENKVSVLSIGVSLSIKKMENIINDDAGLAKFQVDGITFCESVSRSTTVLNSSSEELRLSE